MRECQGDHTHPYLFRPLGDGDLCHGCRTERAAEAAQGARGAARFGAAAVRAALRGS
ncbi:hypothetical protein [Streptomyces caatingaensis]|uniref:hypothetical protein n=1 Tax=Streptomyces caatingaensis TaxID=1678637 RepID=UPI0012FF2D86|nr:hypothetical protein [Streptomyces caatingaensis]